MSEHTRSSTHVTPVDLRDYVYFSADAAKRVRVFVTGTIALDVWCIEPGQATDVLHYPDQDVTYTVIGGRSWFVTDEGEIGLDPMGSILVRAGTVHGIDNRAPDPLVVVASSAPPSDEPADAPVTGDRAAVRPDPPKNALRRAWESLLGAERNSA